MKYSLAVYPPPLIIIKASVLSANSQQRQAFLASTSKLTKRRPAIDNRKPQRATTNKMRQKQWAFNYCAKRHLAKSAGAPAAFGAEFCIFAGGGALGLRHLLIKQRRA